MDLTFDGSLDIAIGRSRKETSWKNRATPWSELVQRVSATARTHETFAEYMAAKKPRQDEIKDVGGFVGGYLTNGRRKAGSVLHRQLVTLDFDFLKSSDDVWADFIDLYGCAAALYSTHKHSGEKPRLRLLIPLDREVMTDEYEAISRKIAGAIGIDFVDHTTFEASRLMYWPSTARDGDWKFEYQDGEWISADKILAEYVDWRDSSEWPVCTRESEKVRREIKKQGDPTEKPGVIGAFCRTFTVGEAIEKYLGDVYDTCDVENRFTYKEGSTAAGLVVYEDKYAFSHHGTDPINGRLCNAFDLVRIHKYGLKDEDAREGTPGNALPSYNAMIEFAMKDPAVKKQIAVEKQEQAINDFSDDFSIDADAENAEGISTEPDEEWMAELDVDRKGNYLSTVFNIKTILENDKRLKKVIAYNEFSRKTNILRPLPWDKLKFKSHREWEDSDLAVLECYMSLKPYELQSTTKLKNVIEVIKKNNTFHPVKDYLNGLKWDGENRADFLFIDYMGAEDNEYTRSVTRKTLVAAVARIFSPGCKFDNVLTLIGDEGIGKSTIYRKIGLDWYTDTFSFNMISNGKQAYEQIQGYWIIEIPEMTGLKKADENAAKAFITSGSDNYRGSHLKETLNRNRQCIFVGTSNLDDFLKSGTGNRRFWPIKTDISVSGKDVDKDLNRAEIDQIWAEAVALYRAGEKIYLPEALEMEARLIQKEHTEEDARAELIRNYLDVLLPEDWYDLGEWQRKSFIKSNDPTLPEGTVQREQVSIAEIWCECLEGNLKDLNTQNSRQLGAIMRNIGGWVKRGKAARVAQYGVVKVYDREKVSVTNR